MKKNTYFSPELHTEDLLIKDVITASVEPQEEVPNENVFVDFNIFN